LSRFEAAELIPIFMSKPMNTSLTKRIPILLGFWCMVMGPAQAQLTPSSNTAVGIISGLAKQIQLIGANTASAWIPSRAATVMM
jgi:hypothetical protein